MTIAIGDKLPDATFKTKTPDGLKDVTAAEALGAGRVALFAVPGAYTPTCHAKHMPSFVLNVEALRAKGVQTIACVSVNDPFVMGAWGEDTGATAAGVLMLADPTAAFSTALGLTFDGAGAGLGVRSKRYSMVIDDGVVTMLNIEESPGQAVCSTGDALLNQL
jgi:peroxiredoxin